MPRPHAGVTRNRPFGGRPAAPKPAPTDTGPLRVLRYQPIGAVSIAPDISVTFSQPMVPLATLAQLDQAAVPVKVTPALDGTWRWIGTRTLRFEFTGAVDRLPMATNYTVEVPGGHEVAERTHAGDRGPLDVQHPSAQGADVRARRHDRRHDAALHRNVRQRVDPAAVITTTTLDTRTPRGRDPPSHERAEILADDHVRQISQDTPAGRWVAFRPTAALPNGAAVTVAIGPGTPSAEGPRTTTSASTHRVTTYSALAITEDRCGYGEGLPSGFGVHRHVQQHPRPEGIRPEQGEDRARARRGDRRRRQHAHDQRRHEARHALRRSDPRIAPGRVRPDARRDKIRVVRCRRGDSRARAVRAAAHDRGSVGAASPRCRSRRSVIRRCSVAVYATNPSRWLDYQKALESWGNSNSSLPGWQRLSTTTITVDGGGHALTESEIDLSSDLHGATGDLIVIVSTPEQYPRASELYWANRPTITWVQATSIGVDAEATNTNLIAWATNLQDGAPLSGVHIQLGGTDSSGVTDADGVARVGLVRSRYLTASKGADVAILPADSVYEWTPQRTGDSVTGLAFDDRGIYRPGETVHVKGWFRRTRTASNSTITPLTTAHTADWSAHDAFGHDLGHGVAALNAFSGFDLTIKVSAGAALGAAQLDVTVDDAGTHGDAAATFQIQEFRRPEFEVVTRAESAGPHLLTQPVTVAALAQYFAGGVLADAPTVWQVTTSSTTYSPPNWSQFTFGVSTPYWLSDGPMQFNRGGSALADGRIGFGIDGGAVPCCGQQPDQKATTYTGRTDTTGTHYVQLNFEGVKPDLPVMVSANASVTDVNRQSFASNLEVLVHPSTLYVGLRSTQQFVREGQPIDVDAIVTDIDGKVVARAPLHDHRRPRRVEVRERHVGRRRRRCQALHADVVEQAGAMRDQGRHRRRVQDHLGDHRRRRRAQSQ